MSFKMPRNILYKFRCEELLCNQTIRSDEWNEYCKKKHARKFNEGIECKKETTIVREDGGSECEKFTTGGRKKLVF